MTPAPAHLLLAAFVDELARCGLRNACTSPGSRSTPLVLALARDPRVRCHSLLDERVSSFFALGLAKTGRLPVALTCTSGTAPAHYLAAVHEAYEAGVPLLVLTADRPPELRGVGAGQTIDQVGLYGRAAKWFLEVGALDEYSAARARWIRSLACRAWWLSVRGRAGVVHLNFPLREPLAPGTPVDRDLVLSSGRDGERPWLRAAPDARVARADAIDGLRSAMQLHARGVVVAGRAERDPQLPSAIARFAASAGYPLLADPLSGARSGPAAIAHYDALLRDESFAEEHAPELVIRVGDLPTSKPLRSWLASRPWIEQLAFVPEGGWQDPDGVVGELIDSPPAATLDALAEDAPAQHASAPGSGAWLGSWRDADARAAEAIAQVLSGELSEPAVAAAIAATAPSRAVVWLASSMPVRDAESFWPVQDAPPRALANRGANGIDGTIASALGAVAAGTAPVIALLGDLALVHDVGALLAHARLARARPAEKLILVVVNNHGGGIFHFLAVSDERDIFEEHIATPHDVDLAQLAEIAGAEYATARTPDELTSALGQALAATRSTLIEVTSDRRENVELHARLNAAVVAALVH